MDKPKGTGLSRELRLRIASAVVISAIALAMILLGGWWLAIWVGLGAGAMAVELVRMVAGAGRFTHALGAAGFAVAALPALASQLGEGTGWAALGGFLVAAIGTVCFQNFVMRDRLTAAVLLVLGLGATLFVVTRNLEPSGVLIALWIPLVTAFTDMGGYFVGRAVGGPKLAPRLSPKKTVSGALGGMACAVLVSIVFALLSDGAPVTLAGFAILAAVVAICGDLAESWVKRRLNVKDAGSLIPGHGGVMDRFDGLAAVTLCFGFLLLLFPGLQAVWS